MEKITNNQTKPKRAVAYARVSDRTIRDNSPCIQKQLDDIKAYAKANNVEIVGQFYDVAKSARNAKRPGLQQMLEYVIDDHERIDYVIVQSLSRLTRDARSYFVDIQNKLLPVGVRVRSVAERFDESPSGQFMQLMHLSQAQYYSDLHRELSQRHRAATAQRNNN